MTANLSEMLMRYLGSQGYVVRSPKHNCVTEFKGERENRCVCVCMCSHKLWGKGKKRS